MAFVLANSIPLSGGASALPEASISLSNEDVSEAQTPSAGPRAETDEGLTCAALPAKPAPYGPVFAPLLACETCAWNGVCWSLFAQLAVALADADGCEGSVISATVPAIFCTGATTGTTAVVTEGVVAIVSVDTDEDLSSFLWFTERESDVDFASLELFDSFSVCFI
jgi:hypothetical protein